MKIKWIGHAAFALTTSEGRILLADPYEAGAYSGSFGYPPINIAADAVTFSHSHADHYTKNLKGNPRIINQPGSYEVSGINIKGIPSFHDASQGKERGKNIIFVYEINGVRIAHLGDLGHTLSPKEIDEIGKIDIMLIPVGGYFTIDAHQAADTIEIFSPKVTIPMHYKTPAVNFPISGVDEFIAACDQKGKKIVKRIPSAEVSIMKETLPAEPEIWVLQYVR